MIQSNKPTYHLKTRLHVPSHWRLGFYNIWIGGWGGNGGTNIRSIACILSVQGTNEWFADRVVLITKIHVASCPSFFESSSVIPTACRTPPTASEPVTIQPRRSVSLSRPLESSPFSFRRVLSAPVLCPTPATGRAALLSAVILGLTHTSCFLGGSASENV